MTTNKHEARRRSMIERLLHDLDDGENRELAFLKSQRWYREHGYSRRWVDQRLRSVSTRQELVSEWHRRGAVTSDDFRELSNNLILHAFGMDVQRYRQYKGLRGAKERLRDHMSDLELSLLGLAESTAIALSRERNSNSIDALNADVRDAGRIVAQARHNIGHAMQVERTVEAPKAA
jgi:DNA-damage-inducible protein D